MATKVLYLGNGKWCYTKTCSQHQKLIQANEQLKKALVEKNETAAAEAISILTTTEEGKFAYYQTLASQFKKIHGRKPILGLDLDGTSADFTHGLRWHMATKDAIKVPREQWEEKFPDPDEYDYHQGANAWFKSREEFLTHFRAAEERGVYKELRVYDNVVETTREFKEIGVEVKVVTARNAIFNEHTTEWLKNRPITFSRIENPGHRKEDVEADVYFDDAPVVINRLIEHEKKVIIRSQAYNSSGQVTENEQTIRVADWKEDVIGAMFKLLDRK